MQTDMTTTMAPELTLAIGGKEYGFSELDDDRIRALEAWVLARTPHPLDALKGDHIANLTDKERETLFNRAMARMDAYPPRLDGFPQQLALIRTVPGQRELLAVALGVHHPEITPAEARRIYQDVAVETDRIAMEFEAEARKRAEEGEGGGEPDPLDMWSTPFGKIFHVAFGRSYLAGRGE